MLDYAAYIRQVISRKGYVLSDLEERINKLWLDGNLNQSERDELIQFAADNAADSLQIDVVAKLADLEMRVYNIEHPVDQYEIWTAGKTTKKHEIVRFDVTGDGDLDLCQYNGGRSYTALGIGKIEGWYLLDRELNRTHTITRDADGGYVLTPIEPETQEEA